MLRTVYTDLWSAYLQIFRGRTVDVHAFEPALESLKPSAYSRADGNVFVVFNSGRLADQTLLRMVSAQRHSLDGVDVSKRRFYFTDVRVNGYAENELSLRRNTLIWLIRYLPSFLLGFLTGRSVAAGLIQVYQKVFKQRSITKLDLFTSNSRFIELMRMGAISSGLQITEYLHGVCSDVFADYYRLLHRMAAGGQLTYVNMAPRLPQPDIIKEHLLWYDSLEVYFQNEAQWQPYAPERSTDVLIVGSDVPEGAYWDTKLFENDLALMRLCLAEGLRVVYCAHPLIYEEASAHVPQGVLLGRFRDHVNSTKVLVGHSSTALFVAHLVGKKIFLFKEALNLVPAYFFGELLDPEEVSFDRSKVISALESHATGADACQEGRFSLGYSLEAAQA